MTRRDFILATTSSVIAAAAHQAQAAQDPRSVSSARTVNILGLPFESKEGQIEANVDAAIAIIREEIARSRCDLVVLPELFTCGYCGFDLSPYSETADGPTVRKFAALTRELDVLIGFGFAESSGKRKVYNSWMLLEPDGRRHLYRKTHLHPTTAGGKTNEPEFLLPGKSLEPFTTRLGSIGVMICYDGCMLEVPRVLALKGADFILWPSRSGEYLASQSLPQVRSLDNAMATILVEGGQIGPHLPTKSFSVACSEKGSRLVSQRNGGPFRVTIDIDAGRKLRASNEAGAHSLYRPRRPELYGIIGRARLNFSS